MVDSIGRRLKELRHLFGYRQEEVAGMLGVERHALSQYETGARIPPSDIIARIAGIYGVSTDYILGVNKNGGADAIYIDVTGLTQREISVLSALVDAMKEKGNGTGQ